MTVRQVFYAATVRGIVEKTERGYRKVQVDLAEMRRAGVLPYHWLADSTRWMRKPESYGSMAEALAETARLYRRDLWADSGTRVEVWLEKDALAGVVDDVTYAFDVPLMVTRGYASLSFLHAAAEAIIASGAPTYLYHLGDFDPSGVNAAYKVRETLRDLAPEAEIHFERLAVTEAQIAAMRLPTRPTKASDSRAKGFGPVSVELDAIPAQTLRDLTQAAIERHLPAQRLEQLRTVELEERRMLHGLVGMLEEQ
ncbi:MAG: hypothetical protein H0T41_01090 [Rhodobacteraceae bacterium]|nr:hypothetical protein [Paracoccaceae bacterium]